jgi:hypothetical protein
MKKYILSIIAILCIPNIIVSYMLFLHNSKEYHIKRVQSDSNSVDLYEWIMGYRDANSVELHLTQLSRISEIRPEVYTYDFKNSPPNDYSKKYFYDIISGLNIAYAHTIGKSAFRDDKEYNYYFIAWADTSTHKILEERWIRAKSLTP